MSAPFVERPTLIAYQNQPPINPLAQVGAKAPLSESREIWIQRIGHHTSDEAIAEGAIGVQAVLLQAYSRRFEGDNPAAIPEGTFKQYRFDPSDPARVTAQSIKMREAVNAGSQYFIASTNDPRGEQVPQVVGVAKVSPSVTRVMRVQQLLGGKPSPNMFLDDIVVSEERRGVGSLLVGAAIDFGGFKPSATAALHAFYAEPSVNQWFFRLGFHEKRQLTERFAVGAYKLDQALLVSNLALREIRERISHKHADIDSAKPA